jgi:hypothetical protein
MKIFALEAGQVPAHVVGRQMLGLAELAGEKTAAQRAVGDEADAKLANGRQQLIFRVAGPQRIFALQGRNRMNGGRPAYRVWRRLRQAEIANLSLAYEIGHGAHGFFDWRLRVDPVLIVEIDHLDPESLEACLARLANTGRVTPGAEHGAFGVAHPSELCRQHDGVALTADRAAEQLFVAAHSVRVRAVKKCDAAFDGVMEGGNRLFIVAAGLKIRHPHATKPKRGNLHRYTIKSSPSI